VGLCEGLRQDLTMTLESVKRFAGADHEAPVFEPEAKRLLSRIENIAPHYEVRAHL
jgi:hypothetical protein